MSLLEQRLAPSNGDSNGITNRPSNETVVAPIDVSSESNSNMSSSRKGQKAAWAKIESDESNQGGQKRNREDEDQHPHKGSPKTFKTEFNDNSLSKNPKAEPNENSLNDLNVTKYVGTKQRTIQSFFVNNTNAAAMSGSTVDLTMSPDKMLQGARGAGPSLNGINSSDISSPPALTIGSAGTGNRESEQQLQQQQRIDSGNRSGKNSQQTNAVISSGAMAINDLKSQLEKMRTLKEQAESKVARLDNELKGWEAKEKELEERYIRLMESFTQHLRSTAQIDAKRKKDKSALDCARLGKIVTIRQGPTSISDVWEDGYAVKDLANKAMELVERKEALEKRRKALQSRKRSAKKGQNTAGLAGGGDGIAVEDVFDAGVVGEVDLDILTEEFAVRAHMEQLKRDESGIAEERRLLEQEKATHMKELKRVQNEERSRFAKELPCFNRRYQLLSLLGKGGFSEVWRAMDMYERIEVAVKIHQLSPVWSDERKQSYIRHVTREYTIHRDMMHDRVVRLFDVFEIDVNSFATVLELCKGIDLDETLKTSPSKTIAEKEAKVILMQILSGLKYLNTPSQISDDMDTNGVGNNNISSGPRRQGIIHFDLKPANILFDEFGDAKITDFGLSKELFAEEGTSMEMTSVGAGTYWYLPPEVFDVQPRISNKVDVWSIGVIYFQMLFGKRPFGEGMSQERVLQDRVILNANKVDFPTGIKVSDEAKDFIRDCLTRDQQQRPDVLRICNHPYLRSIPKKI